MSEFDRYLLRRVKDGAQPELSGAHGPLCTEDKCQKYDGKRCMLMARRPERVCEPAVIDFMKLLREEAGLEV